MEIENEHLENQKKIKIIWTGFFPQNRPVHPVHRLDRRFKRSNPGSVSIRSNDRTEPELWPAGDRTGRSGPVFKTMLLALFII